MDSKNHFPSCHRVRRIVSNVTSDRLLHPLAHFDVGRHLRVGKSSRQYRFCREWIVIAER